VRGLLVFIQKNEELEVVAYTSCGGCPGGNIEYAPKEMIKNGAEVIHFATGFVVGYPPCPYLSQFKSLISKKYGLNVVIGTHPIPQKYYDMHSKMNCWQDAMTSIKWEDFLKPTISDEAIRKAYN